MRVMAAALAFMLAGCTCGGGKDTTHRTPETKLPRGATVTVVTLFHPGKLTIGNDKSTLTIGLQLLEPGGARTEFFLDGFEYDEAERNKHIQPELSVAPDGHAIAMRRKPDGPWEYIGLEVPGAPLYCKHLTWKAKDAWSGGAPAS